jgi:hypothetical protein
MVQNLDLNMPSSCFLSFFLWGKVDMVYLAARGAMQTHKKETKNILSIDQAGARSQDLLGI